MCRRHQAASHAPHPRPQRTGLNAASPPAWCICPLHCDVRALAYGTLPGVQPLPHRRIEQACRHACMRMRMRRDASAPCCPLPPFASTAGSTCPAAARPDCAQAARQPTCLLLKELKQLKHVFKCRACGYRSVGVREMSGVGQGVPGTAGQQASTQQEGSSSENGVQQKRHSSEGDVPSRQETGAAAGPSRCPASLDAASSVL